LPRASREHVPAVTNLRPGVIGAWFPATSRKDPHHPGETIRGDYVEAVGLRVAKAAAQLHIEESTLAAV